ncbi:MAG: Hsp20/alpha crystallin family protein [Verrucomicrobiota bacterium]
MKMIRYQNPGVSSLMGDFDRLFGQAFGGFPFLNAVAQAPAPLGRFGALRLAADLFEDDDHYFARVELPGAKKDDVKVDLDGRRLTVAFERETEGEGSETVAYKRSLAIPDGVSEDTISAKLEDGILTVTLPKAPERKPRQIEVG